MKPLLDSSTWEGNSCFLAVLLPALYNEEQEKQFRSKSSAWPKLNNSRFKIDSSSLTTFVSDPSSVTDWSISLALFQELLTLWNGFELIAKLKNGKTIFEGVLKEIGDFVAGRKPMDIDYRLLQKITFNSTLRQKISIFFPGALRYHDFQFNILYGSCITTRVLSPKSVAANYKMPSCVTFIRKNRIFINYLQYFILIMV